MRRNPGCLEVLFLALALIPSGLFGQSTWTGAVSSSWSVAGNWSGSVPNSVIGAIIPAGTPNSPSTAGVTGAACGSLAVNAGATVTIAPTFQLSVSGDVSILGAVAGAGLLRTVGLNTSSISGPGPIGASLEIAKTGTGNVQTPGPFSLTGNLTQLSGTFYLGGLAGPLISVGGNASFQGGILTSNGAGTLDVAGNVTFSGASVSNTPTIQCAGNWTSDANFAPASGQVVFTKTGAQSITGPTTFPALTIQAGSLTSASSALTINGDLMVNGGLVVAGALDANHNVTVAASGALDIGGGTDTIGQSLTVNGSLTATGTIVFDGIDTSGVSSVAALPNVQIAKTGFGNVQTPGSFNITGDLTQLSGTFYLGNNAPVVISVGGNASFQGGILTANGTGTLDVAGNVTFSGTSVSNTPTMQCAGNWTSDANFAPATGQVVFTKTGAQSITGPAIFPHLTIQAGSLTSAPSALTINGDLMVNGGLVVAGALDANNNVTVAASGALDIGGGTDTIGQSLTVNGSLTATGTVVFDGNATSNVAVAALPNVQIAKTGFGNVQTPSSFNITGDLTQLSGTFYLGNNALVVVSVAGNASFQGGILTSNATGLLDVAGNVTFSGTSVMNGPTTIQCAGNWTADANFAAVTGTVELDGAGPTTIASSAPGGTLTFRDLVIKNGARTMANDFTIAATSMTIDSSGSLSVNGGRHLRINRPSGATSVAANGALGVATNSELSMGPQTTVTVGATGALSLIGAPAQPAKVTGEAGGGYGLIVNGALAAKDFVVKEMAPGGMLVDVGATIAAAPNNLRNGTFDFRSGAPPGSVLLDMRRNAPAASFDQLAFLNTPALAGVFNVRTSASGVPISFTNWTGAFAGPSFEDDPSNLIAWNVQSVPPLTFFKVRPGADRVEVLWQLLNQVNVAGFQVRRAFSAAGPFTLITTQGPGNPGNGFVDLPLAANQPVFEAVYATMTQGDNVLFGIGSATPYSSAPPPNVKKVGGNGPFSTIQAAINASTDPNSVVWVTPGTYAGFSIGAGAPSNLHVMGDGTGPVNVDTSAGPVQISNVPLANGIELSNLAIGTPATGQPGVIVTACAGPVVLDALSVACSGAQTAVSVSGSTAVAVQRCTIQGGTGLSVTSSSHVALSRGSLTSLVATTSTVEMASLTPGSVNVTPAGSLQIRGLMPDLNLPEFASMAHPQFLTVDAFPNSPFIIIASPRLGYMDFPQFEMPVLVDLVAMATLPPMFTDFTGFGISAFEIEPIASILGFSFVVQVGVLDPGSGVWRFSNVETMVAMP